MVRAHVPTLRIVLAAALSLLVELTILRYLPGQVRVLGYFTNSPNDRPIAVAPIHAPIRRRSDRV